MLQPTAKTCPDTCLDVDRADGALSRAGLPARAGWKPVRVRREEHDGRPVTVVRFQRDRSPHDGRHLTVVLDADDVLLGYTRLDPDGAGASGPLPTEDEARRAAFAFLAALDPAYAAGLSVLWIARHDEHVTDPEGRVFVISGMKVKTRHTNGRYAWVVVGSRGTVLTCEREIRWDASAGRRGTEMWLHDIWIAARDGAAPAPSAPYARV